ncbi:MAG: RNA methyltransferase [Deltaproteobacteria bacterium]|nr:RNA methyltransferase [Deltaproteobacteria bacterium]
MADLYVALVHHPILNKGGQVVTTSVTNFDLHDLARNCRTFDVKKLFIVTPSEPQLAMVDYIKEYWHDGWGASYNPDRKQAFDILQGAPSVENTTLTIKELSGTSPVLVATTAKKHEKSVAYTGVRELLKGQKPVLLIFGTGHGLTEEFLNSTDQILDPIYGASDYNHLPVRSAVAIILDRLRSQWD